VRFAETLMLAGLAPSVGSVGDCDNALAATLIGLHKTECVKEGSSFRDGPLGCLARPSSRVSPPDAASIRRPEPGGGSRRGQ